MKKVYLVTIVTHGKYSKTSIYRYFGMARAEPLIRSTIEALNGGRKYYLLIYDTQ